MHYTIGPRAHGNHIQSPGRLQQREDPRGEHAAQAEQHADAQQNISSIYTVRCWSVLLLR